MKKYIDAEAFFKVINTLPYKDTSYPDASAYNGAISDVADMLAHFPAADVEPRWIPVTERFPEEEGTYLVTYTDGGVTEVGSSMYLQREDGSEPYWDYFVVIAWMPLPEPYKVGEEE